MSNLYDDRVLLYSLGLEADSMESPEGPLAVRKGCFRGGGEVIHLPYFSTQ